LQSLASNKNSRRALLAHGLAHFSFPEYRSQRQCWLENSETHTNSALVYKLLAEGIAPAVRAARRAQEGVQRIYSKNPRPNRWE
jgi:hypothetical protein